MSGRMYAVLMAFVLVSHAAFSAERVLSDCEKVLIATTTEFADAVLEIDDFEQMGFFLNGAKDPLERRLYYSAIHYLRAHKIEYKRDNQMRTIRILADSKSKNPIVRLATALGSSKRSKRAVRNLELLFSAKGLSLNGVRGAYDLEDHEIWLGPKTLLEMENDSVVSHEISHAFIATLLAAKVDSGFFGDFHALSDSKEALPLFSDSQILGTGYDRFLSISELYAFGKGALRLAAEIKVLERKLKSNPSDQTSIEELKYARFEISRDLENAILISKIIGVLVDTALKHYDLARIETQKLILEKKSLDVRTAVLELHEKDFAFKLSLPLVAEPNKSDLRTTEPDVKVFVVRRLALLSRAAREITNRFLELRETAEKGEGISAASAALNNSLAPLIELK